MRVADSKMNTARYPSDAGKALVEYRRYWIAYWLDISRSGLLYKNPPSTPFPAGYAREMVAANWLWAKREQVADQVQLDGDDQALLLDVMLEYSDDCL